MRGIHLWSPVLHSMCSQLSEVRFGPDGTTHTQRPDDPGLLLLAAIRPQATIAIYVCLLFDWWWFCCADLLAISPSTLIQPIGGGDREREAKLWDCFAEVYEKELQQLQQHSKQQLCTEKKRQILADILVWAEVTQAHYDQTTAS